MARLIDEHAGSEWIRYLGGGSIGGAPQYHAIALRSPSVAEELFLDVPDALMTYAPLNANHRQYKDQENKAGYPPKPKQSVISMECTPVGPRLLKTGSLDGSKINKTGAILRIPLMFLRPPEP